MATNNSTNNSFPSGLSLAAGGNVLTNYNEAVSWVPIIAGSTSAGTATYTTQSGYYTRVGNMIFCSADVIWNSHTGTGNLLITNLPFNSRNLSNYNPESIVNTINISLPGGTSRTAIGSILTPGTNIISAFVTSNAGANTPISISTSGEIHITIAYLM